MQNTTPTVCPTPLVALAQAMATRATITLTTHTGAVHIVGISGISQEDGSGNSYNVLVYRAGTPAYNVFVRYAPGKAFTGH